MSISSEITRISKNVSDSLDAVALKGVTVPSGSTSDDLPDLIAQITGGGSGGIVITDTADSAGGTIRTITAVDLSSDTVTAGSMLSGVTAHDNTGTAVTGSIATKTGSDLSASGDTVTVPAGYYASQTTKAVASGSEGTPTATKGTVSNNSVTVTPSVTNTAGYISGGTHTGTGVSVSASELVSGNKAITSAGTGIDVTNYATASVASGSVTAPATISGTGATVSTGTNTLTFSKTVSVTPVVSTAGYVSSGTAGNASVSLTASVNTRSSSDLTASGDTVTVPAGYYASQASKAVSSGSATAPATISGTSATVSTGTNTLTLSKTVSVTPSVTAGYVSSGTAGNSSVSLTASVNTRSSSDLTASTLTVTAPSGYYVSNATKTLTDSNLVAGNIKKDITIFGVTGNYEGGGGGTRTTIVPEQTITVSSTTTTLQWISPIIIGETYIYTINGVERTGVAYNDGVAAIGNESAEGEIGYIYTDAGYMWFFVVSSSQYGTYTIKVEQESGGGGGSTLVEKTITANGTYDPADDNADGYSKVTVNVSGGSSKNTQTVQSTSRRNNTALGSITSLTCSTTGSYDVYWTCARSNTSQTWGSQLYIGGSAYDTENTTWSNNVQNNHLENVSISANQTVAVYGRSRSGYYIYAPQLTIVQK